MKLIRREPLSKSRVSAMSSPRSHLTSVKLCFLLMLIAVQVGVAEESDRKLIKHQITGLFCREREQDLKDVFAERLPHFKLVSIDYENAEASFDYDPAIVFPGAKPEQIVERFDNELRNATRYTFGAKPLRTIPKDKLKRIEIGIVGLDCKACSLAAYEIVFRLKGVEMATASFKEGKVVVFVDPSQIDQTEIEMALKQRGVQLTTTP